MASTDRGFTLVELITIMVLLAVVALVVLPRLNTSASTLQAARDEVIAGLFYAQHLAMSRDMAGTNDITFVVVDARTITVRENGNDIAVGSNYYPLALPPSVAISSASAFPVTLDYTKLGTTTATSFLMSAGSSTVTVNVSDTGYAW